MQLTRFLLATASVLPAAAAQNLLLPDNHHLSEALAKTTGSSSWWGTTLTGRRFQVLYEASHFTNVSTNVTGPIVINSLGFRGEDGESNIGGQTYSGITVDVYKTTLTTGTMNLTTFATNTGASVLLGSTVIPLVTCLPSSGACPNTEHITLPLGALAAFDPTGGSGPEVNILIDIKWTGYAPVLIPVTNQNLATQDTSGGLAVVRGRGIFGTTPVALTGTGSTAPPVVRVGFTGTGGNATLIPARVETIGGACGGSPSAFYQLFRHTQPVDLSGTSLTLTPDNAIAPNFYTVTSGTVAVDPAGWAGVPVSTGDDTTVAFALAGPFVYPGGGSTGTVRPTTNGYIIIDPASTQVGDFTADYSCSVLDYLGGVASTNNVQRLCPLWYDFHCGRNVTTHPGSGLHAVNVGTTALITWRNVGNFDVATAGNTLHTMQCSIDTVTGVVEYRYDTNMEIWADTLDDGGGDFVSAMVGFTLGRIGGTTPSVDPQSRELTFETPFSTSVEGATGHAGIVAVDSVAAAPPHYAGRMYSGRSITWNATNIPAGTILMLLNLDIAASQPGFQFPGITAPTCMISTGISPLILGHELVVGPGASYTGVNPIVVPPVIWYGANITAQYIGLDVFGGPNLVPWSSNTLRHTVGLQ